MKKISFFLLFIAILLGAYFHNELWSFIYKRTDHSLVNYDFGIIEIDDLEKSKKNYSDIARFGTSDINYPYWQCFNSKNLQMNCSYTQPLNEQGSALEIVIKTDSATHFYSHSHAISGEVCDELVNNITVIMKNQSYFCINGTHERQTIQDTRTEHSWSFYRLKTQNGYANYLLDD